MTSKKAGSKFRKNIPALRRGRLIQACAGTDYYFYSHPVCRGRSILLLNLFVLPDCNLIADLACMGFGMQRSRSIPVFLADAASLLYLLVNLPPSKLPLTQSNCFKVHNIYIFSKLASQPRFYSNAILHAHKV